MLRQVTLYFDGPGQWVVPQLDGEAICYYPSSAPPPDLRGEYPPVFLQHEYEYEAVMELRTVLLEFFPDDSLLVHVPPPVWLNRKVGRLLACR